jgi:iron complex outermembrane receptor protein
MRYFSATQRILLLIAVHAALLCTAAFQAQGQEEPSLRELSIEELMTIEVESVYSTSKQNQKVTEAPASVTILSADDIRAFGYRTLADILNSVRGFYTTYDRNYHYAGVRGFGRPGDHNTRILLLVDGHRLNDNIYDTAGIGTEFVLDLDLIARVEVSRGPGSSLYGSNAFFGVINIVTRDSAGSKTAELSAEAASFRTVKGRATAGNKTGILLSGTAASSGGDNLYFREYDPANPYFDTRAENGGRAEHRDYDRSGSWFAKSSWRAFTFEAAMSSREKGVPTAPFGTDFNRDNRTLDSRAYLDLRYSGQMAAGTEIVGRLSCDMFRYQGEYFYGGIPNRDEGRGVWAGGDVQLTRQFLSVHRVSLGAEYSGNRQQDQRNADQAPFVSYLDDARRSRRWAAYMQDEMKLTEAVSLVAGMRYDEDSLVDGSVNPRLAAIVNPVSGSTVKLLYGSAFRSPSVFEQYYQTSSSSPPVVSNPGLRPEKIKTYELVFEQYLPAGLRMVVDGYYYRIDGLINQTMDGGGKLVFTNRERDEAQGLELELEKRWPGGTSARASYALQRAVDEATGDVLENSPRQLGRLKLLLPLAEDRVLAGVEEQYTGPRRTVSERSVHGRALTHVTLLGRNRARTIELSLSCYNLFNKRFSDPVSADLMPLDALLQDGRTFRVKVIYGF